MEEKTYNKLVYLIYTVFIAAIDFVAFDIKPSASNIFAYGFISFIISLFLGSGTIHLFSTKHLNNITYLQRIIILPLFLGLITVSIVSGRSIQIAKDYEAKYKLSELEQSNLKTKLDKTEKELSESKSNYLSELRKNLNGQKPQKLLPRILSDKKDEKPKSRGRHRIGAICCDGTVSSATGRGACSWHGGVCQWLYGE